MVKEARGKGVGVFGYTENETMLKFEEWILKEDIVTNKAVADATLLELTSEEWKFRSAELLAELDGANDEGDNAQDGENDAAHEDGDISSEDDDDSDEGEDEIAPNSHASQLRPPIPKAAAIHRLLAILRDARAWHDIFPGGARSPPEVIQTIQPLLQPLPR